jgi:hypothetical protein
VEIPILSALKECYLLWHNFFVHLPRLTRYTLGSKIDTLFLDILELALAAKYTRRDQKHADLETLSRKLDQLKFFLTLLWETKALDANKYGQLSGKLTTVGRMLGRWMQSVS